jgi:hypothetical protein
MVVQHPLFHHPRYAIIVLGRGAQARSVPDSEFFLDSQPFFSPLSDPFTQQFANLESGEDSADVENSFQ